MKIDIAKDREVAVRMKLLSGQEIFMLEDRRFGWQQIYYLEGPFWLSGGTNDPPEPNSNCG